MSEERATSETMGGSRSSEKPKYKSKVSGLYAKAKQRILNKLGRRTLLTRYPKADGMNKRIRNIDHSKNKIVALSEKQKSCLEGFFQASSTLRQLFVELWKTEGYPQAWSEHTGSFGVQLNDEQVKSINLFEKDYAEFENKQTVAFQTFLAHLEDFTRRPLTNETPDEVLLLYQLRRAKKDYKQKRTRYSDAIINLRTCSSPPSSATYQHLEENVELAKNALQQSAEKFCSEAWKYQQLVREQMFERIKHYFTNYKAWISALQVSADEFFPWMDSSLFDFSSFENSTGNDDYEKMMGASSVIVNEENKQASSSSEEESSDSDNESDIKEN
ncbi:uncharacterized protein Gasu_51060 [Galdieria sulphuraria]|uniref:BAR domain-containing protein n=1 Tax=Galdieria sulphuraria TaxID=130081 RepID=M2WU02_GALSU|nr:uncharacterized protein Gasu_51060 [Galdieria sulphuraria]EME27380.1 hypothetical protein Gasu_51060 [Galdieria sulphuraria]|eukprot:XP_005703900.1 hypothetical protein Gasu_51060 [Galdieria sulphuraria]